MERRSHIQQHPHQESRKGYPVYASNTRLKSTTNDGKDYRLVAKHSGIKSNSHPLVEAIAFNKKNNTNRYFIPFRDDEDSDERTIYFGENKN